MKILAVCGSLQAKSGNLSLLNAAAAAAPPGVEVVLFDGLRDLPHFNPDLEASGIPGSVTRWRQALADSDAVLIACPEYGFSLPGALKNAIDWAIGSGELEGKIVAITGAVPAPERGRRGLQALRDTLSAVRATIVGGDPIPKGPGFEPRIAALVRDLVDAAAPPRREADCILRPAVASEQKTLEALQRLASLANAGDRQALLVNPDAIELPIEQIANGQVFVAERHGATVGFAAVLPRDDSGAELDALFVEPDLWKQGIGRLLVDHCAGIARARGATALHVIGNPHAEGFYLACGFERIGTIETRFGAGLSLRKIL